MHIYFPKMLQNNSDSENLKVYLFDYVSSLLDIDFFGVLFIRKPDIL